jgi:hypothetical protein
VGDEICMLERVLRGEMWGRGEWRWLGNVRGEVSANECSANDSSCMIARRVESVT